MLRLSRIIKAFQETGALNENISIFGFLDEVFLTKAGDLGTVLAVEGVDYECLASTDTRLHPTQKVKMLGWISISEG